MSPTERPADRVTKTPSHCPDIPAGGRAASAALRALLARVPGRPVPTPRALEIEAALLRAATSA